MFKTKKPTTLEISPHAIVLRLGIKVRQEGGGYVVAGAAAAGLGRARPLELTDDEARAVWKVLERVFPEIDFAKPEPMPLELEQVRDRAAELVGHVGTPPDEMRDIITRAAELAPGFFLTIMGELVDALDDVAFKASEDAAADELPETNPTGAASDDDAAEGS
jgi:hypothetical protein